MRTICADVRTPYRTTSVDTGWGNRRNWLLRLFDRNQEFRRPFRTDQGRIPARNP